MSAREYFGAFLFLFTFLSAVLCQPATKERPENTTEKVAQSSQEGKPQNAIGNAVQPTTEELPENSVTKTVPPAPVIRAENDARTAELLSAKERPENSIIKRIQKTSENSTQNATQKVMSLTSEENTENSIMKAIQSTPEQSLENTIAKRVQPTPEERPENTTERIAQSTPEQRPENRTEKTVQLILKEKPANTTENTVQPSSEENSDHFITKTVQITPKERSKNPIIKLVQLTQEEKIENVTEEAVPPTPEKGAENASEIAVLLTPKERPENSISKGVQLPPEERFTNASEKTVQPSVEKKIENATQEAVQPTLEKRHNNLPKKEVQPLSLEALFREFRQESKIMAEAHLGSMLLVASYGDHFYNLEEVISAECQRSLSAIVSMTTNLCTFEKVDDIMDAVMADGYDDIINARQLKHPLELLCYRIEQHFLYASLKDPQLYIEFVATKVAMKNRTLSRRRPYLIKISRSEKELSSFYLHMMKIPQMAKYLAHEGFEDQLYKSDAYNRTFHILAKSILVVARKEEFKNVVQELYDKTLCEVADFISQTKYEKLRVLEDNRTYWFSEIIMSKLKGYFDDNVVLKLELEKTLNEMDKLISQ